MEDSEFEYCVNTERFGTIYERYNDFFIDRHSHWRDVLHDEQGKELKKDLEEYVDWLFEMRDKQQN